jgi:TRAP-type C4-dicarboxylate transport system permease small subunit
MKTFEKVVISLSEKLNWVACAALLLMVLLVCANIITRLFGEPLTGTYELVEVLLVVLISFSLAYGSVTHCHIGVDLVARRLSGQTQLFLNIIISVISMGLFALIGWRCVDLGTRLWRAGEVSITLWIPHFPLLYGIAFNSFLVCFVILLIDILKLSQQKREK